MPTNTQRIDFDQSVVWPNITAKDSLMEDAINWMKDNLDPEDIFSTTQLEKWAESEGYIKATDND